ncbi:MAG: NUDIX hydrolase [Saprospiraceae bacterium]
MDYSEVPIQPAATVVCTRQNEMNQLEILLLRRNKNLKFASGFWVFPGGKIEPEDGDEGVINTISAKAAAIREAEEEANLNLRDSELIHFMNWTTPSPSVKRFNTWFFIIELFGGCDEVIIDNSEIKEYIWLTPKEAIFSFGKKNIKLLPPTFLTLVRFMHCQNFSDIKNELNRILHIDIQPKTGIQDGLFLSMYPGDAGYEAHDVNIQGARHRISGDMAKGTYRFEYHGCDHIFPVNGGYKW